MSEPTCEICGKPATLNIQKTWVIWPYFNGEFEEPTIVNDEPEEGESFWRCDNHADF